MKNPGTLVRAELFYEMDVYKHKHAVMRHLSNCAKSLLDRGTYHDDSKLLAVEYASYVEPVWRLNTEDIEYGSEEYEKITAAMGPGWEHHKDTNDHHPEHHGGIQGMNLFQIVEMLCDWIAASSRNDSDPKKALEFIQDIPGPLKVILSRTIDAILEMDEE